MRVLHVAESIKGGCGTYLDQIVPAQLRDADIAALRVIVPDAHAAQVASIPADRLAPFALDGRSAGSFKALATTLRREVKAFRPDVVHLHSTFAGLIGRPLLAAMRGAGRGAGRPRVVYCAHGWAFDMQRSPWKLKAVALAERALAPLADRIVAISEYERRRGIEAGIAPALIATVWNGLADRAPPPPAMPGARLRVLFVGRMDRQKGYDTLFDAVGGLGERVELRMVGSSVVGDHAEARALPPHVALLGWKTPDEIADELAWADLVVIPSRWEGFGLVALEAMRAGRAVLASDVGGLPEVVADGVTGRLIAPGDARVLREAVVAFDAATLAAMGAAGRRRFVDLFTIDKTVAGLKAVYRAAGA